MMEAPKRPGRKLSWGVWVVVAALVVALAAVGVLAWRSVNLSSEVETLRASATTTLLVTTTTDPWAGQYPSYYAQRNAFLAKRDDLVHPNSIVWHPDLVYGGANAQELVLALAYRLNEFPRSSADVERAQDAYFAGLMRVYSAAKRLRNEESTSNRDAYERVWAEEERLLNVWLREIDRSR